MAKTRRGKKKCCTSDLLETLIQSQNNTNTLIQELCDKISNINEENQNNLRCETNYLCAPDCQIIANRICYDLEGTVVSNTFALPSGTAYTGNVDELDPTCAKCNAVEDKIFADKECWCDTLADGSIVRFMRITCYNHTTGVVDESDRTEDLKNDYQIQGEACKCDNLGQKVQLVTLPFCNNGITFYRTFDKLTNIIVRSFDGNMNSFVPVGDVVPGSCGGQSNTDCDDCDAEALPEGLSPDW